MQLHYHSYGQGEPLVILHGLFGSHENWHSLSREFGANYTVIAVDLRNHGRSPHLPDMSYRDMAGDVAETLDAQGLKEVYLLGHSMGGKTAMQFSILFPGRVKRLLIADIAPKAYPPGHGEILEALWNLDLAGYSTRHQMVEALAPTIPELAVRQFLLKNVEHRPGGAFQWRMNLTAIRENYEQLIGGLNPAGSFAGPALFLRGGKSDYVTDRDLSLIRESFPQATIQTIETAGHWLHAEAPAEFVKIVMGFLQKP